MSSRVIVSTRGYEYMSASENPPSNCNNGDTEGNDGDNDELIDGNRMEPRYSHRNRSNHAGVRREVYGTSPREVCPAIDVHPLVKHEELFKGHKEMEQHVKVHPHLRVLVPIPMREIIAQDDHGTPWNADRENWHIPDEKQPRGEVDRE